MKTTHSSANTPLGSLTLLPASSQRHWNTHTHTHTHRDACTHTRTNTHKHTHMHTGTHKDARTYGQAHAYTNEHTHTHTTYNRGGVKERPQTDLDRKKWQIIDCPNHGQIGNGCGAQQRLATQKEKEVKEWIAWTVTIGRKKKKRSSWGRVGKDRLSASEHEPANRHDRAINYKKKCQSLSILLLFRSISSLSLRSLSIKSYPFSFPFTLIPLISLSLSLSLSLSVPSLSLSHAHDWPALACYFSK